MASTIPTARTRLVANLVAKQAAGQPLAGVAVFRTGNWKERQEREQITVRNATSIEREPMLGAGRFVERYTLPVHVIAIKTGGELQPVEDRLWVLVSAVEQIVLADSSLTGLLVHAYPAGSDEGENSGPADNNMVFAEVTLNVICEGRPVLA